MSKATEGTFSQNRQVLSDIYDLFLQKHYMTGIVEVDVTEAKRKISDLKESGIDISFSGWILFCLSRSIKKHPNIYSYRKGRRKIKRFDDIDILLMVEKAVNEKMIAVPLPIRSSQGKSILDITDEIRSLQRESVEENRQLLSQHWAMRYYSFIPKWIRMKLIKRTINNPDQIKKQGGLAIITSVGMFANNYGWILGTGGITTINIAIGTISIKPRYIDNNLSKREILNLTISIDHDIYDGAPAARFAKDFIEMIESGAGLSEI